jgi:hypothetical protein
MPPFRQAIAACRHRQQKFRVSLPVAAVGRFEKLHHVPHFMIPTSHNSFQRDAHQLITGWERH